MTRAAPSCSQDELHALLQREERQFLDLQWLRDRNAELRRVVDRRKVRDWIAEYAAAFANADGSTLVLGVDHDEAPTRHGTRRMVTRTRRSPVPAASPPRGGVEMSVMNAICVRITLRGERRGMRTLLRGTDWQHMRRQYERGECK